MIIYFEPHGTTFDNETNKASGWNDVALSSLGEQNARDMGKRYAGKKIDAVFCSDLERSYKTAQLAFPDLTPDRLFIDWRLRECDYGELTCAPKDQVNAERAKRVEKPFPGGESYTQTMARMKSFIHDLKTTPFETVVIIGHRATHYGLDHWIDQVPIGEAVTTHFVWQPGWKFELA